MIRNLVLVAAALFSLGTKPAEGPPEWPPIKPGAWTVTITDTAGKRSTIHDDQNCAQPELIFWKSFFQGNLEMGGCRFSSKKLSQDEYLFTGECGTRHDGLAVMRNRIRMTGSTSFEDFVDTAQRGKVARWRMEGRWVKGCGK